jgi:MFS family permease
MRQTISGTVAASPLDTTGPNATPVNAMAKRATIASTMGAALEWIDFAAYGAVAATIFPKIFFSAMDPNMGILAAFVTFGVGFFARPLGGLFFGMLGDRLTRLSEC